MQVSEVTTVDWRELSRMAQVMIWVVGLMHDMAEEGIVDGGFYEVTEAGHSAYKEMLSEGFAATQKEVESAMAVLQDPRFLRGRTH